MFLDVIHLLPIKTLNYPYFIVSVLKNYVFDESVPLLLALADVSQQ